MHSLVCFFTIMAVSWSFSDNFDDKLDLGSAPASIQFMQVRFGLWGTWFVGSICACVLRHLIWWRKNKSRYHSLHVSEQSWRQWRKEELSYHPWLSRSKVQKFRQATPTRLPWHLRSCRLGRRQACQNHAVAIGVHGGDERSSDVGTHLVPSSQAEPRSASSSNLLSLLGVALLGGAWTRTAGCRRLRTWSWVEWEVSVAQQMVGPS